MYRCVTGCVIVCYLLFLFAWYSEYVTVDLRIVAEPDGCVDYLKDRFCDQTCLSGSTSSLSTGAVTCSCAAGFTARTEANNYTSCIVSGMCNRDKIVHPFIHLSSLEGIVVFICFVRELCD